MKANRLLILLLLTTLFTVYTAHAQYADCAEAIAADATQGKACQEVTACGYDAANPDTDGVLDAANTYYLLTQDITADDSCIMINNVDITFDLNEYTVFYAANPSDYQSDTYAPYVTEGCRTYNGFRFGIVCHHGISDMQMTPLRDPPTVTRVGGTPDWFGLPRASCDRLELMNGRIEQISDLATYSDGIRINCRDAVVHDITWYGNGDDTMGLSLGLTGGGDNAHVYSNTFISDSTFVSNRHQTPGIIKTAYGDNWDIHDNTIIGGPCIGMALANNNRIYNNDVSQKQYNDNAYSLRIGHNNEVYNNYFHPQDGRGILMDSTQNNSIHHNDIIIQEGGTTRSYGVRIRTWAEGGSKNNWVWENNITALAGVPGMEGSATAIVLSLFLDGNGDNYIVNNTIRAITYNAAYQANGLGFDGAQTLIPFTAPVVKGNVFTGNNYLIDSIQDPGNGMPGNQYTFENNHFIKETIGDPTGYALIHLDAPGPQQAEEFTFLNATFDGTSFADVDFDRCDAPFSGSCSYDVEWFLDINVDDQDGTPLDGAIVTIEDAFGTEVYSDTTTDGRAPQINLMEYYDHSRTGSVTYTPYTVTATLDGNSDTQVVDMTSSQRIFLTIYSGPCTEGATRQCGTTDVGECTYGTETCTGGVWGSCVGAIGPATEMCTDTLDNDCDGLTDDLDVIDCPIGECTDGQVQQCGTTDVGACSFGNQTCTSGAWGGCVGAIDPVSEICDDGIDNDCDGETDFSDTEDCAVVCYSGYDQPPCDNCIDIGELSAAITGWFNNDIDLTAIIDHVKQWKTCG